MSRPYLLAGIVLLGVIATVPVPVAADDEYPDDCDNAEIIDSGQFSGEIDTPGDRDSFRVRVAKGDRLSFSAIVSEREDDFRIEFDKENVFTSGGSTNNNVRIDGPDFEERLYFADFTPGVEAEANVFAEESGILCFQLREDDDDLSSAEIPYSWEFSLSVNDPEAPSPPTAELRSQIDELESQVSDLQNRLEEKNQRISELESRVEELQSQSGDVSIQVEVTPSGGQNQFVPGQEAQVSASTDNGDLSKLSVEYEGETYSVGSDGTATVPLGSAGTKEMTFSYEDTEQSVSLDVASSETEESDQPDSDSTSEETQSSTQDSDGDGVPDSEDYAPRDPDVQDESDVQSGGQGLPGFGITIAAVAVIAAVVVLTRFRRSERK